MTSIVGNFVAKRIRFHSNLFHHIARWCQQRILTTVLAQSRLSLPTHPATSAAREQLSYLETIGDREAPKRKYNVAIAKSTSALFVRQSLVSTWPPKDGGQSTSDVLVRSLPSVALR